VSTVANTVTGIFERIRAGELSQAETEPRSGWEVALPSGRIVARSALQAEAQPLIILGAEAVPELLPWVMNEHPALRYVAVYALGQITGKSPHVPYFADRDDEGYREKASDEWRSWYAANSVAGD